MNDAWSPYTPDQARPWTARRAGHLLRRAGFGFSRQDLQQAIADGPQRAIDRLAHAPAAMAEFDRRMSELGAAVAVSESGSSAEPAALWLHRIAETPWPLLEKTTLFWHDHFAIAGSRAGKAMLIERHLRLLRRHALGRFDALLRDIVRDPATLLAMEAKSAPKSKPPLALAGALAGRWTTGAAAASEGELREIARCFTGASVLRDRYHMQAADRDVGAQATPEAAAAAAASHPAAARNIARRAYRWFVSETAAPDDATLAPLAAEFARSLDFGRLVETILRSNLFFSDAAIGQRVKSPVEYAFSIGRAVAAQVAPAMLHQELSQLGQRLLEPPTREGWAGGRRWLNHFTLVRRANLAETLVAGKQIDGDARQWWELLLQRQPPAGETRRGREAVLGIVTSAEFQMA